MREYQEDIGLTIGKVTVIVPIYQAEDHLRECLESLRTQKYSDLEILLINDGSTDSSKELCSSYVNSDSRFNLINQENGGLSAARNTGLKHATGDYILFVDSDDVLTASHISELAKIVIQNDCDIAITNLTPFGNLFEGDTWDNTLTTYAAEEAVEIIFYQGDFDTCAPAKLYQANIWNNISFPEGYIHEDLPTVYKVLLRANKICFKGSTTYGYRYSDIGLNHSITTDKKVETVELIDELVKNVDDYYPRLTRAAKCFRTSFCFHLLLNATDDSITLQNRQMLKARIVADRKDVIMDRRARLKTRLACVATYFGFNFTNLVYSLRRV